MKKLFEVALGILTAIGARFGYQRRDMKGPLLAGWLYHGGHYVAWDRVRAVEQDRIVISGSVTDLPEPGPAG